MAECPYQPTAKSGTSSSKKKPMTNRDWWPDSLNLTVLHQDPIPARPSHVPHPSTTSVSYNLSYPASYASYASKFEQLDLVGLRNDIYKSLTTSNTNWPADYGHYGPLIIRLAWHSAGTYRVFDGRGGGNTGNIRLPPLNSWPDNGNLDKAMRYILWPLKRKYGQSISWGDLIILAGNVAIESMMGEWGTVQPLWFGGGRVDAFAPEEDIYWGHEPEWLKDDRHTASESSDDTGLQKPLGAVQMGLIYVNPEGPGGNPDILASAKDIRETFGRMGMNDVETVALIAGGHTFGKAHGAADPGKYVGAEPEGSPIEQMGTGWKSSFGSGKGKDAITSGLEGAWTANPTKWDNGYFDLLFKYEWTQTKSPAGATQWIPSMDSINANGGIDDVANVPDAHDGATHLPIMFTTDLALRYDAVYGPISEKFHENPEKFTDAFLRAWYKLCHRDMGPVSRHLGPYLPNETLIWQDPIPAADYDSISTNDVQHLKLEILDSVNRSEITISDLVKATWATASTYRCTDHRGGANGSRIRLSPQRYWAVNDPSSLAKVISIMESIQKRFNAMHDQRKSGKRVSFADLVVLGGNTAIEEAARRAGHSNVRVPFVPGRTDALQSETDVDSFNSLQPSMDGFRNYNGVKDATPESSLVDRAHLLTLTIPEMVVLVGGLRVLNANSESSQHVGVFTDRPGVLTNDFFTNLLDENTIWSPVNNDGKLFEGRRQASYGKKPWMASRVDLVLGSNAQLRAVSESYACVDSEKYFVRDFINAWTKVTMLDRFDLLQPKHVDGTTTESVFVFSRTVSRL